MTKLIGLHPEGGSPGDTYIYPGQSVAKLPSPNEGFQTNPTFNLLPGATRVTIDVNPRGSALKKVPHERGMMYYDYVGRQIRARNYWKLGQFPNHERSMPIDTYSCRFYHTPLDNSLDAFGGADSYPHLITFMNDPTDTFVNNTTTDRFSLMKSNVTTDWTYEYRDRPFFKNPNGTFLTSIPPANIQLQATQTWRIQIQVQPTAPKVTLKVWIGDNTGTPYYTVTCNPAEVSMDSFMLGRHADGHCGTGLIPPQWFAHLEIWDTYDLDGQADQPYQAPRYTFSEMVGGVEVPVIEEGVMSGGVVDTADKQNFWEKYPEREFVFNDYTHVQSIFYDSPSRGERVLALWYPNGTPPPGGFKTIILVHGGFFSAGTRWFVGNPVPYWMVKWMLYKGWAVISMDYIFAWQLSLFDVPKPAWPQQGSGQFPSFIVDVKLAGLWVQEQSTYPLNPEWICVGGHSAGAYLAQAAAISRDLNNLNGHDLTVNSSWGYRTGTADPFFRGAYGWATPTDMWWAYQNDVTHPDFGPSDSGQGALKTTANLFYGKDWDYPLTQPETVGSSLADMIAAQSAAKIPHIGLCHGRYDAIVPPEHMFLYEAALSAKGVSYDSILTNKDHDTPFTLMPERHFTRFMETIGF